jgi:hypothetical protein
MWTKQEYLLSLPFEYILGFSKETGLVRDNKCFTKKDFVQRLLRSLEESECKRLYEAFKNGESCRNIVNWFLGEFPTGEIVSKNFVEYLNKTGNQIGTLYFEFPIVKTRVDILRLTDRFHAYEVKSQRDRLDRLHYQVPALMNFFEYVSLIIPRESMRKIADVVQEGVGIITFDSKQDEILFEIERQPRINDAFNPLAQLRLLQMEELKDICTEISGLRPKQQTRREITEVILKHLQRHQINEIFKLKIRGREQSDERLSRLNGLELTRYF